MRGDCPIAGKARLGEVADHVFTVGDQYVVAHVTAIKPKGILALDLVKDKIKPEVIKQVKGKMLSDKLQAALNGSTTIAQVAQKSGSKVMPLQNIVFANPVIPGVSTEYKVVGTIFGLKPNQLSKPVEGDKGVFAYIIDSFTNPAPMTNALRQKEQLSQVLGQRAQSGVLESLKDKANVKDYRARIL